MLIYAHRGASGRAPENTPRAFVAAIEDGADGVEFDVRATADGVPVVIHDRDVGRTTTGTGFVDRLTLAELRGFDAGEGQTVPTLEETLAIVAGPMRLDIELKQAGIEDQVLAVLARFPHARWAISSFDWAILRRLRALDRAADLWPLTMTASPDALETAADLGSTTLALFGGAVTADVAARLDAADLDLMVWTVNRIADARLARQVGAAAICTDIPREMIAEVGG